MVLGDGSHQAGESCSAATGVPRMICFSLPDTPNPVRIDSFPRVVPRSCPLACPEIRDSEFEILCAHPTPTVDTQA